MKLAIALLVLAGCAGADVVDVDPAASLAAPLVATPQVWLTSDSPAYEAQLAWGLPVPCNGLTVTELPLTDLQPVCNSEAELAARSPNTRTLGCSWAERCAIAIASDLDAEQRAVTMAHELGHILARTAGHVAEGCPEHGAPGPALMCAGGPASRSPEPTALDYAFAGALGLEP